jgi:hypothetical protein
MQKWSALVFGAVVIAFIAAVFVARPPKAGPAGAPTASSLASLSASAVADAGAPIDDAGAADAATDGGPAPAGTDDPAAQGPSDAGATLIDGTPAPQLDTKAPKSVVFGVILVTYKGAQGAAPTARSREEALKLAKELAEEAKKDWKATVSKGDKGSAESHGRIHRGFLEPAPEYVLFSLPKDGVSDPVDTPRGYWIIHRIE